MKHSISRKDFLTASAALGLGGMLTGFPVTQQNIGLEPNPDLVLGPDEGEVYLIGERQGRITIKVDKQQKGMETMSLLTEDIKPGDGIPVHKHAAEEELIYISKGTGIFTFGDEEYAVSPGSMALVPRTVWHGLRNESDAMLQMVFGYTPSGFEDYFRAIGVKPGEPWKELTGDDWQQINRRFGITYRD